MPVTFQLQSARRVIALAVVVAWLGSAITTAHGQHFPMAGKPTFPETVDGNGDSIWVSGFNLPNNYGATVDTSGETNTWQFDRTDQAGIHVPAEENTPVHLGDSPTPANGAWWTTHNTFWPGIPGGYEVNAGNGDPENPDHTTYNLTGFRWPGLISEVELNSASGGPWSDEPDQPWGFVLDDINFISPAGEKQLLPLLTVDQTIFLYFRAGGPNGNGNQLQLTEQQLDVAGVSYGPHPVDLLNGVPNPRRVIFLSNEGQADNAPNNQGGTWDIYIDPSQTAGVPYAVLAAVTGPMDGARLGSLIYQAIPGDYNLDGIVDIADYTTWADNFGSTGAAFEQGDGNLDGTVDIADYTVWADHFGLGGAFHAAAVPEPMGCTMILGGILAMVMANRRQQDRGIE